ncbi:MAG: PAS domain S-box protein [Desulfarculaceae bacterium]|nr:PAS domain S-box protein [Desulfarculaceae bacterium]
MIKLHNKKWLAVYGAALAIVLIMALMVGAFHRSQGRLRASYLDSFQRDLALRATMVGLFHENLAAELKDLAASRRVSAYFGNQALGMSMEYGLAASLHQIAVYFEHILGAKRVGGVPVWLRLVLVDEQGRVLASRAVPGQVGLPSGLPPLTGLGLRPTVLTGGENAQVVMAAPCTYLGHPVGRVVGWMNPQALCANFTHHQKLPAMTDVVVAARVDGSLAPVGCSREVSRELLGRLTGLGLNRPHLMPAPANLKDQGEFLAVGVGVEGTPLVIYSMMPARRWLGDFSPWQLSLVLGLSALLLMSGVALLVWSNYRNAVLAARLDQEELDHREVERSYRKLRMEMAVRERTERALRASEERFRGVFDNASLGIMVLDRKGRVQQANPAWLELMGYGRSQLEGLTLDDLSPAQQREEHRKWFRRLVDGEVERLQGERRAIRADGELIWLAVSVSAVRGPSGELDKAVGVVADISQRKQAVEALENSEEKFNKAFQATPDSAMISRLSDGVFLEVNDSALAAMGYARPEMLGRSDAELGIWAHREEHDEFVGGLREQGEVISMSAEFRGRDGRVFPVLVSGRLLELNGEQVVVSVAKDMTEAKRAEEALAISEHRYRSLVENVPYGIFIADYPNGQMVFVNQAICDMFGYTLAEGLAKSVWQVIAPEDHVRVRTRMQSRIAGAQVNPESDTFTALRKDGSSFRCEVSVARVSFRGKMALQGILRDVTEKEILERQLQHAQKMESLGTLAGGVAHEFNNILMTFRGYIQLLQMRSDLDSEVHATLLKMEKSSRRAGELTQKMLTFSRLETGEKVPVKLNQVIRDAEGLLSQTFPPAITLRFDLVEELPLVLANPNQIEQVLVNLALNARDAMSDGGELTIATRLTHLDADFASAHPWARPGPYLEMRVADQGPGIPPEELERIFEPFFTTKEPGRGTGLGLAVAYSMIKNHGGGIVASNRPGKGSQFQVFLPVGRQVLASPRPSAPPDRAPRGEGQRVLVVDDEEAVRDICRQALEGFGYRVELAADGVQALETYDLARAHGEPFDLVLLDLAMPRMDGQACARALLELDPEANIILATGHAGDRYQLANLYPQAKAVLQKPFDLNTLLVQVDRVLHG